MSYLVDKKETAIQVEAREKQAAYAAKRREHREKLGLAHQVGDRNGTEAL